MQFGYSAKVFRNALWATPDRLRAGTLIPDRSLRRWLNNTGTDCNGALGRSDVLCFEPIGIGPTGYTDVQVTICSSINEPPGIVNGDQDNKQPEACAGAGGILAHATTPAFAENTDVVMVVGNNIERDGVTNFTSTRCPEAYSTARKRA